jgi:hypothetical protein
VAVLPILLLRALSLVSEILDDTSGQRFGGEADGAQRASGRYAVPDGEQSVAGMGGEPAARIAVHVERA